MSYDAFMIVMLVIAVLSGLFFILALVADIVWPLIANRQPHRQATYRRKQA